MRNTRKHNRLVRKVLQKLKSEGYTEFYREVRVDTHKGMFFVDLVAIKGNEMVAIECGETSDFKLGVLCNYFENVVWCKYNGEIEKFRGKPVINPHNIIEKHVARGGLSLSVER